MIVTKQLSVKKLTPRRESKLKLIKSLSDKGWNTKRISDFLNSNKLKILLVNTSEQKFLKRLKRFKDYKIINLKNI